MYTSPLLDLVAGQRHEEDLRRAEQARRAPHRSRARLSTVAAGPAPRQRRSRLPVAIVCAATLVTLAAGAAGSPNTGQHPKPVDMAMVVIKPGTATP